MAAGDHRGGERPTMWSRAERHTGEGAGALFARLGAAEKRAPRGRMRRARAAAALERAAARLRAGDWSAELAELAARAEALERATSGKAPREVTAQTRSPGGPRPRSGAGDQ